MINCRTNRGCNCSCHTTGAVHVVACCYPCLTCKDNISVFMYDAHVEDCRKNYGERINVAE